MARIAFRIDENQPELVKKLRELGASVSMTHMVGDGFPDIVVGWGGTNYLFEIKSPTKPPSKRKLSPDEERWRAAWKGEAHTVLTFLDCLDVLEAG